ncbi:flavin reductase family protein [Leptospira interrogans]|uniref:flavin reductase family protein n=1 Tax=Leptospira interrogans TaxID=173 RepID=UPI00122C694A|nr:flavin reductase family protein [Leptospira interrogans]KAA1267665.1 flavin reductase [Leptospira interrogans serovar Weerasinghe]MBE0304492.1 flavin reductase family protein [Leptospira interrogans serovar Yeoncheon]MBM2888931.1 flavin reductase family protein [Leptospira interrogans]ULG79294.1 flavin reductase family protein [Leptospira interrogans]UML70019.1 flavin reductase family protein [Leptospira interrogans]
MKITDEVFKNALSHFPSGVTVITYSHLGKHSGLTVSSFSSLSLDPPLILFCLQKNITSHDPIYDSGKFVVNILAQGQDSISNQFASGKTDKHSLMGELGCKTGDLNVPILPGILSYIECEVDRFVDGGDHSIVIGKVISAGSDDGLRPLLYYRRNYYSI